MLRTALILRSVLIVYPLWMIPLAAAAAPIASSMAPPAPAVADSPSVRQILALRLLGSLHLSTENTRQIGDLLARLAAAQGRYQQKATSASQKSEVALMHVQRALLHRKRPPDGDAAASLQAINDVWDDRVALVELQNNTVEAISRILTRDQLDTLRLAFDMPKAARPSVTHASTALQPPGSAAAPPRFGSSPEEFFTNALALRVMWEERNEPAMPNSEQDVWRRRWIPGLAESANFDPGDPNLIPLANKIFAEMDRSSRMSDQQFGQLRSQLVAGAPGNLPDDQVETARDQDSVRRLFLGADRALLLAKLSSHPVSEVIMSAMASDVEDPFATEGSLLTEPDAGKKPDPCRLLSRTVYYGQLDALQLTSSQRKSITETLKAVKQAEQSYADRERPQTEKLFSTLTSMRSSILTKAPENPADQARAWAVLRPLWETRAALARLRDQAVSRIRDTLGPRQIVSVRDYLLIPAGRQRQLFPIESSRMHVSFVNPSRESSSAPADTAPNADNGSRSYTPIDLANFSWRRLRASGIICALYNDGEGFSSPVQVKIDSGLYADSLGIAHGTPQYDAASAELVGEVNQIKTMPRADYDAFQDRVARAADEIAHRYTDESDRIESADDEAAIRRFFLDCDSSAYFGLL